ncbi:hypothetical protein ACE6H2_015783 [Prunus campanulata]
MPTTPPEQIHHHQEGVTDTRGYQRGQRKMGVSRPPARKHSHNPRVKCSLHFNRSHGPPHTTEEEQRERRMRNRGANGGG